jgi:hypothetical protein
VTSKEIVGLMLPVLVGGRSGDGTVVEGAAPPGGADAEGAPGAGGDPPVLPGAKHCPAVGALKGIPDVVSLIGFGPGLGYSKLLPAVLLHSPALIWPILMSPKNMSGASCKVLVPDPVIVTAAQF